MLTISCKATGRSFPIQPGVNAFPHGFLHENGSYRIEARGNADNYFSLFISDEEISASRVETSSVDSQFRWDWTIDFYAGQVLLQLIDRGAERLEATLDIAPNKHKLGSEEYYDLIADLQLKAEGLVFGMTPARITLEHQAANTPLLARFVMLRVYISRLERVFGSIAETPHRQLFAEREERPLHRVRRVDRHSLQTALKRMPVLAALQGREHSTAIASMDVPKRVHTFDTSPNRHVLSLLARLKSLCLDLQCKFESQDHESLLTEEYDRRPARYAKICSLIGKRVSRMQRASFLEGIAASAPDTGALLTVARHPTYARFDQIARRILEPKVSLGDDVDKLLSLRRTFDIYEYWCFFQILEITKAALPDLQWQDDVDILTNDLLLNLVDGSSISGTGEDVSVTVTFQEHYGAKKVDKELFSISRSCKPDIVLEIRFPDSTRTIIFDAKYRSSLESIHAGLSDMHVYKDAIRKRSDNTPGIHAVYILTPGHHALADRYYTTEYRHEHDFGAFDLSPRSVEQVTSLTAEISRLTKI